MSIGFTQTLRRIILLSLLVVPLLLAITIVQQRTASAEYVEHRLIEDGLFLDAASMSHQAIQDFLVARQSYLAGYSTWSDRDNATVSASQIIYEAAQDYGISPKVILATLQKEQSLVTAQNPSSSQLNFAMGYGCPDSSGCGEKYRGFFRQVDNAAWQFRFNYETSRGNKWWNPNLSYPCGGSTRYYSPGLIPGNYITWYDDAGIAYKAFTIQNGATASLYCYTPHAYPGSESQYYSGSFNFVLMYERWFGSTQAGVTVGSPLWVHSKTPGHFTNSPITVAFEMANTTADPINVGGMTVAVRDANGGNFDFPLKQMTVPAFGRVTYVETQTLPAEGEYTFWISNFSGGAWKDNYPSSWSIDAPRKVVAKVQAMPTITIGPNTGATELRQQKGEVYAFAIKNNSAWALNIGKVALAVRGPGGVVADLPLKPVSLSPGASYTYSDTFTPPYFGTYTAWITQTTDNFIWNETSFPASANGVNRKITFDVKASPTLTQSPALSVATPRVGQSVNASFKVKNYGDQPVNAGIMGLAIRDPQGRNVDAGGAAVSVGANSEYTFNASNLKFTMPGTYTAWVTGSRDGGRTWDDTYYPIGETPSIARKITFTVLPNPTITVEPTVTTTDPRVGKSLAMTFTIRNYAAQDVSVGKVALAMRDAQGKNVDLPLRDVTIPANSTYVYSETLPGANVKYAGTYTAWITQTNDQKAWNDTSYPYLDGDSIKRKITFEVKNSPTLTQGPTFSVPSPQVNQLTNASFKIKNFGDASVNAGIVGLAIRDPQGRNVDAGGGSVTINANSEYTFSATGLQFTKAGTYTAWVTVSRDNGVTWDDTGFPPAETGAVQRKITFTVQP